MRLNRTFAPPGDTTKEVNLMTKRRKFLAILLAVGMIFAVAAAGCKPESAHTHEYGEWTTVKEATCGEKGLKEKTCSCGAKIEEEIAATGEHNYVWTVEVAATCGAATLAL